MLSSTPQSSATQPGERRPFTARLGQLVWLLVPLLAAAAFTPVLGMWFIADDFGHLTFHTIIPFPQPFFTFPGGQMFYRPLSTSIIWDLGYALFGTHALPYHITSLVLHALAALLLARAVYTMTSDARIGWLSGALFGVYPLSTEPLSWLASQWDVWAAACAMGALWGFTAAWKKRDWRPYVAGLVAAALAVMMKESSLPLPAVLPFVALVTDWSHRPVAAEGNAPRPLINMDFVRRAILWTIPYGLPALGFVLLRVSTGGIGGYPGIATDYQNFFWDSMLKALLFFLMPLNRTIFDPTFVQIFGLVMSAAFLLGLMLWGKRRLPLLLLSLVWFLAFLAPVLNLSPGTGDALGNRFLYFALVGFCIASATLLVGLIDEANPKWLGWAVAVGLVVVAVPVTWVQLSSWVQTSRQTRFVVDQMKSLIRPKALRIADFNVKALPTIYKGSYAFLNGFGDSLYIFAGQPARAAQVQELDSAALTGLNPGSGGTYNLAFRFNSDDELFYVSEMSGITPALSAPTDAAKSFNLTNCTPAALASLQAQSAALECASSDQPDPDLGAAQFARFTPTSVDGSLQMPDFNLDLSGARWVRLAVCMRMEQPEDGHLGEWFWGEPDRVDWSQDRSHAFRLDPSPEWRVYWTYLPADSFSGRVNGLRFDPVNAQTPVDIAWISADPIK